MRQSNENRSYIEHSVSFKEFNYLEKIIMVPLFIIVLNILFTPISFIFFIIILIKRFMDLHKFIKSSHEINEEYFEKHLLNYIDSTINEGIFMMSYISDLKACVLHIKKKYHFSEESYW